MKAAARRIWLLAVLAMPMASGCSPSIGVGLNLDYDDGPKVRPTRP